jgi:hypothetical protein
LVQRVLNLPHLFLTLRQTLLGDHNFFKIWIKKIMLI